MSTDRESLRDVFADQEEIPRPFCEMCNVAMWLIRADHSTDCYREFECKVCDRRSVLAK
jgi:hypothetical protein